MTITKHEPLSEERCAALRNDPDVVFHRRADGPLIPFVSKLRVTGYIDTLELLGRRDDEEENEEIDDPSSSTWKQ